jgi:geranylgeranyl diphosphate synthase, type II
VHRNKTGALIRAACRMGAMSSPTCSPAALAAISTYADAIGLMFQAVDDLIDVTQTSEAAGKRTGKDAEAGKLTYPSILGVEGTRAEIARMHRDALNALTPLGERAEPLATVAEFLATRTK